MFRSCLIFVLQVFVLLIAFGQAKSTTSKRLQKCHEYSTQIYGQTVPNCESSPTSGIITNKQFPYIAILGYQNVDSDLIIWLCHGTLVSSRYILTTADCLRTLRETITKVRLGVTSNVYSDESNSSNYDIEETIIHPLYKPTAFYNDIGLGKLSRNVQISESVRPICLPESDLQSNILSQVNYKISEPEDPLNKYEYTTVSNKNCNVLFSSYTGTKLRNGITNELMCIRKSSGASSRYARYACLGEAGAPLYIDHPQISCSHIQLGISSFGTLYCRPAIPNVATKVFNFADWIESVIWKDGEDA